MAVTAPPVVNEATPLAASVSGEEPHFSVLHHEYLQSVVVVKEGKGGHCNQAHLGELALGLKFLIEWL